jgi:hypothetical protein
VSKRLSAAWLPSGRGTAAFRGSDRIPLWAARAWLRGTSACDPNLSDAADHAPEDSGEGTNRPALHYAGPGDPRSEVVRSDRLRAGDLIVVSAEYGGCDEWGWDPKSTEPVTDVAEAGAWPYGARRFAVRVTPELIRREVLRESESPVQDRRQTSMHTFGGAGCS